MIENFLDGFKTLWGIDVFKYAVSANILIMAFVFVRRLTAACHSKGSFFRRIILIRGSFAFIMPFI